MSGDRPRAESVVGQAERVRRGELHGEQLLHESARALAAADAGPEPVHALLSARFEPSSPSAPRSGPLAGIPVAVKDNLATTDFPTTCGSRVLEGYRSPFDATVVRRLRAAGAVLVGKTNLDEFAMGSSTERSAYGPTRNPLARGRVPGGSSGGSAAAVAAGIVPLALGSDTGGSVRQPAAFCGIVGIKPTYGRVSRYGLVAMASSLDQVGGLARTVADVALLMEVIAGPDALDSTCLDAPPPRFHAEAGAGGLEGVVVGVPEEFFPDSLDAGIRARCDGALSALRRRGAALRAVSLPSAALAVPAYAVIAPAEASSNLARFDGARFGPRPPAVRALGELYQRTRALLGPEVKRRVLLGTFVLSEGHRDAYYQGALRARARIAADFRAAFAAGVDVLFTPTTPTPAFPLGERLADPYAMYLADVFTAPASLAGLPAISLPIGSTEGLPVGGQLIGRAWDEAILLRIAAALEAELGPESSRG